LSGPLALTPLDPGAVLDAGLLGVPGSKSITNRALICAALADGETVLQRALYSDDSKWMVQALRKLGVQIDLDPEARSIRVHGAGKPPVIPMGVAPELFVGNAGTAARFLPCLVAAGSGEAEFRGDPRMSERPMGELLDALKAQGAEITPLPADTLAKPGPGVELEVRGGRFPFLLNGRGLSGGRVEIDLTASTQFASGLMMAAPYASSDLQIVTTGDRGQLPYVDMTLAVMEQFGVLGKAEGGRYTVAAGQRYWAQGDYAVEPDLSGAAYVFAAAALAGGKAGVLGVGNASIQGDIRFLKVLQHMGARFYQEDEGLWAERHPAEPLKGGVTVDMNAFSDQALTLAALAPFASGPITITNVGHIRRQECDRIDAIVVNLAALGIRAESGPDWVKVHPGRPHGGTIRTFGDHRVAMAFGLLGLRVPGVVIDDPDCVSKTFADYWTVMETLKAGAVHGN
jgi:3-phosphoshikimate 1-carboxyvinyltransferase